MLFACLHLNFQPALHFINVKTEFTSVIDSHIENSKNWNCEFSCRAHRHNAEVLRK